MLETTKKETKFSKMMSTIPFFAYKSRSDIQRISLTGVFFGLVLLFQYLEHFMPFGETYLKLNFSLLFILPIFYFAGPIYGTVTIILRFVIGPAMGNGYNQITMISHFILLVSTVTVILFMFLYSFLFSGVKSHNKKIILISIATVISTSVLLTLLNGLLFSPMYWYTMQKQLGYSFGLDKPFFNQNVINAYKSPFVTVWFFGIKNYWGGVFAVYLTGNLVKFGLVYIIYLPMSKVMRQYLNVKTNE